MLAELSGKGGRLCQPAGEGRLHCPLIIRPNSEDAVTANIAQCLRVIDPRWWLADLLNSALGTARFRRQAYRWLRIEPWVNLPAYPRELLPWAEGSTQVDLRITWENPPTTVFVEAKYASDLTPRTANDDGTHGFPSDQLVRNARVGLHSCGWFDGPGSLFEAPARDFVLVLLAPRKGHPLAERYRDPGHLRAAIPHADRLMGMPPTRSWASCRTRTLSAYCKITRNSSRGPNVC